MILLVPQSDTAQLAPLIALIPNDPAGVNAAVMAHYAAGLMPASRVAAYFDIGIDPATPVGYIKFELSGHVGQIAVHPEYRRRGIGDQLLAYALERQSCTQQSLYVEADNTKALAFYAQAGFVSAEQPLNDQGVKFERLVRNKSAGD